MQVSYSSHGLLLLFPDRFLQEMPRRSLTVLLLLSLQDGQQHNVSDSPSSASTSLPPSLVFLPESWVSAPDLLSPKF